MTQLDRLSAWVLASEFSRLREWAREHHAKAQRRRVKKAPSRAVRRAEGVARMNRTAEVERRGKEAEARGEAFLAALAQVSTAREALRILVNTVEGYECESFGHDVLDAAMSDARSVLASLKETGA